MMATSPAVAVLPMSKKLGLHPGQIPVGELMWPLGLPPRLEGKRLQDLLPTDHLIMTPRTTSYFRPSFGTRARVSIMVLEPEIIHGRHIKNLRRFYWRFFRVLSSVERLVNAIPNGVLFPFGSTWVPDWQKLDVTKTRMTSLIATAKRSQPGHFPRHEIAEWAQSADVDLEAIGRGYKPFEHKSEGLAPYRFSVVIENAFEPNYFTEKLIDAILCETVPIYMGCPNIHSFLDTNGMILCNNVEDIKQAVRTASADLYEQMLPALRAIKPEAARLGQTERRAAEIILAAT